MPKVGRCAQGVPAGFDAECVYVRPPCHRRLLFDEDVDPLHRTIDDVEFERALRRVGVRVNGLIIQQVFQSIKGASTTHMHMLGQCTPAETENMLRLLRLAPHL